jgi:hypothetical protein
MMSRLLWSYGLAGDLRLFALQSFVSGDRAASCGTRQWHSGVGNDFLTTPDAARLHGLGTTHFVMAKPSASTSRSRTQQPERHPAFPDAQIYDFYVLDAAGSQIRWRWSQGMSFDQAPTQLTFAPYSTKAYSVTWNGVLGDGTQLPAGNYRARGAIVADEFGGDPLVDGDLVSNMIPFTVR